jgi:hypothetical protein
MVKHMGTFHMFIAYPPDITGVNAATYMTYMWIP